MVRATLQFRLHANVAREAFVSAYREAGMPVGGWESVTACSFMARQTPGALRFANRLGAYLQRIVENARSMGKPIWYADQTALFYCWLDSLHDVAFGTFTKPAFVQRGSWQLFQGEKERLDFLANP